MSWGRGLSRRRLTASPERKRGHIEGKTSIMLDDQLGQRLRDAAKQEGKRLGALAAEASRAKLGETEQADFPAFNLITFGGGGALPNLGLDKTRALMVTEDESRYGQSSCARQTCSFTRIDRMCRRSTPPMRLTLMQRPWTNRRLLFRKPCPADLGAS